LRAGAALGDNIIETIINKSEKVKELKNKAKEGDLTAKQNKEPPTRKGSTGRNASSYRIS
jgi:hypothetical protein